MPRSSHDTPVILCLVLLALSAAVAGFAGDAAQRSLAEVLIRVVTVVGIYVFVGHSGVMSFGHVAFMGVGAYGVAWTSMEPSIKQYVLTGLPAWLQQAALPWLPATLLAGGLAALVAALAGAVILRLVGIAAAIATFALLAIFNVVYSNWDSVTAGTSSIVGIPTPVGVWQALAFACAAVWLAHAHARSGSGLALRAVREEPVAARSCGIDAWKAQWIAFVLSAFVCGVAGALDAQFLGVVNPDAYYLGRTFTCLAMLVIGGVASLSGAVTGVLAVSALIEVLVRLEKGVAVGAWLLQIPNGAQEVIVGLAMIGMLMRRPNGLLGHAELRWPSFGTTRPGGAEPGVQRTA